MLIFNEDLIIYVNLVDIQFSHPGEKRNKAYSKSIMTNIYQEYVSTSYIMPCINNAPQIPTCCKFKRVHNSKPCN